MPAENIYYVYVIDLTSFFLTKYSLLFTLQLHSVLVVVVRTQLFFFFYCKGFCCPRKRERVLETKLL